MCYHIAFEVKLDSILDVFPDLIIDHQLDVEFPQAAYINGFNHQPQQVMLLGRKDNKRHLALMRWGFIPPHIKNQEEAEKFENGYVDANGKFQTGYANLNAIGEELLDKRMYKDAARNRRCVVFIESFYEWYHHYPMKKNGEKRKTPDRYPHHLFVSDNPYKFTMVAGIWTPWKHTEVDKESGEVKEFVTPTFAMTTAKANWICGKIHNSKGRMPTILTKELAEEWITEGLSDKRIIEIATYQYPSEKMSAYSITKDFQSSGDPKAKHKYEALPVDFCDY